MRVLSLIVALLVAGVAVAPPPIGGQQQQQQFKPPQTPQKQPQGQLPQGKPNVPPPPAKGLGGLGFPKLKMPKNFLKNLFKLKPSLARAIKQAKSLEQHIQELNGAAKEVQQEEEQAENNQPQGQNPQGENPPPPAEQTGVAAGGQGLQPGTQGVANPQGAGANAAQNVQGAAAAGFPMFVETRGKNDKVVDMTGKLGEAVGLAGQLVAALEKAQNDQQQAAQEGQAGAAAQGLNPNSAPQGQAPGQLPQGQVPQGQAPNIGKPPKLGNQQNLSPGSFPM